MFYHDNSVRVDVDQRDNYLIDMTKHSHNTIPIVSINLEILILKMSLTQFGKLQKISMKSLY